MTLLHISNLSYSVSSKTICEDVNFSIESGKRYGLIGPNGAGKTTLIKLLCGDLEPDEGTIQRASGIQLARVEQEPDADGTVLEYLLSEYCSVESRLYELQGQMADPEHEGRMPEIMKEYERVNDEFLRFGGYEAENKAESIISKLGLTVGLDQDFSSLSGGERSIVALAKAVMHQPELLILDEPGNHLDYLGIAWLEEFLKSYQGCILMVSHDRKLLDAVCTNLLDFEGCKIRTHQGNYSGYRAEKYAQGLEAQHLLDLEQKNIRKLEQRVKALQNQASASTQPPVKVLQELGAKKRLLAQAREREENYDLRGLTGRDVEVELDVKAGKGDIAVSVEGYSKQFDDLVLFHNAGFDMAIGERLALVGLNGTGKTTFIRDLMCNGSWDNPAMRIGPSLSCGYVSQHPDFSENAITIADEVQSWGALSLDKAFHLVKKFLFTYEEMQKPLAVLSGGERMRLQFARIVYEAPDFLVLDEPTNHLDIGTREVIEEALKEYRGTLLVISHDRQFLDSLAERVVEIHNRSFVSYEGGFSDFFKKRYPVLPRSSGSLESRYRERRKEQSSQSQRADQLESRISELEADIDELNRQVKDCFKRKEHRLGERLSGKLKEKRSLLDDIYQQWESCFS